jgi:hypothetical protein
MRLRLGFGIVTVQGFHWRQHLSAGSNCPCS